MRFHLEFLARPKRSGYWRLYERFLCRPSAALATFEALPPDYRRIALSHALWDQIVYFAGRPDALPEWGAAARVDGADELWKIWESLPIVSREMLNTRFHPDVATTLCRGPKVHRGSTGGSTGEPTAYLHDDAMIRSIRAGMAFTRRKMGWSPGLATIVVWGSDRDIGKRPSAFSVLNKHLCGDFLLEGYHLRPELADRAVHLVRRHAPVAIYGFSSMLEHLSQSVLAKYGPMPAGAVRTAWNGGEILERRQIELFRRAFGVPILNRYGSRELGVIACQYAEGAPLRVLRPWIFLEVVDSAGRRAAPGETGRILCTSTVCRGTPFLRYDTGDLGSYLADDADESGIGALRDVQGRTAGMIRLPNGAAVNNIFWNHLFKEHRQIRQFQVVVAGSNRIDVLLVADQLPTAVLDHLHGAVQSVLGSSFDLRFELVDFIPLTSRGKRLQVVTRPAANVS